MATSERRYAIDVLLRRELCDQRDRFKARMVYVS